MEFVFDSFTVVPNLNGPCRPLSDKKHTKKPAVTLAFVSYWNVLDDELVEVRGIEPLSENIQHNSPTCVADDLKFAVAHAHRPA